MASTLTITLEMGNAAFVENCGAEVARILNNLADNLKVLLVAPDVVGELLLMDINGNRVGTANAA